MFFVLFGLRFLKTVLGKRKVYFAIYFKHQHLMGDSRFCKLTQSDDICWFLRIQCSNQFKSSHNDKNLRYKIQFASSTWSGKTSNIRHFQPWNISGHRHGNDWLLIWLGIRDSCTQFDWLDIKTGSTKSFRVLDVNPSIQCLSSTCLSFFSKNYTLSVDSGFGSTKKDIDTYESRTLVFKSRPNYSAKFRGMV